MNWILWWLKKSTLRKKLHQVMVCTPPFSCGVEGGGGLKLQPNFQKGGKGFNRGVSRKEGGNIFLRGGRGCGEGDYNFYKKNELKSITIKCKKSYKQKYYSPS